MSYRFLRVTDYYGEFLSGYYSKNPDIHLSDYKTQYNNLTENSIEIVSSYGKHMRKMGIDAIDLISNAVILQKTWAKEHNLSDSLDVDKIIIKQIEHYKPDILWIDTTKYLNVDWIRKIKIEVKSIKKIVGHICAPYNSTIGASFLELDTVFTCSPCIADELRNFGVKKVELIYHAFDHTILEKIANETNPFEQKGLIFTGSILSGYGLHQERLKYIEAFIENKIDLTIYGNLENPKRILMKKILSSSIKTLKKAHLQPLIDSVQLLKLHQQHSEADIQFYSKKLLNSTLPPVFGLDMYKALAKSTICFNIHGDIAKKCGGNIRLFEATGIGTCLLTDYKENMKDLFDVDNEIVTYQSIEECIEKIKWLENNPTDRLRIAQAGQKRTIKDHTIENRVNQVNQIFINNLKKL
ncbi:MAG: glycosyltransferase family 1 protein [Flavobacteriales bacterium]|nr:glycosyltransferase family 1 protein [Flavobacteriales bacterium]